MVTEKYEVQRHGDQYVVVPVGYDRLRHGGVLLHATGVYGSRKAADAACAKVNA